MASKMIIDREKTAQDLKSTLRTFGPRAAEALARDLGPVAGEDLEVPDMDAFQLLLQRRLGVYRDRLVEADEAHLRDLRRLRQLREDRDEAVGEVRRLFARLRSYAVGVFGPKGDSRVLLLEGPTPRDPVALVRAARRLLHHLRNADFPSPAAEIPGATFDPSHWTDFLREPVERIEEALLAISKEKPSATRSLMVKNEVKAEYDRVYNATTRMLQEFFRYVGMDSMASAVRPRRRRARRRSLGDGAMEEAQGVVADGSELAEETVSPAEAVSPKEIVSARETVPPPGPALPEQPGSPASAPAMASGLSPDLTSKEEGGEAGERRRLRLVAPGPSRRRLRDPVSGAEDSS